MHGVCFQITLGKDGRLRTKIGCLLSRQYETVSHSPDYLEGDEREMKLLIVTDYITPDLSIASIRWTKLGKYLKEKYTVDQIDVLTTDKSSFLEQKADSMLGNDRQYLDRMYLAECPFWIKYRRVLWTQFRKWKKPPEKRHKSIDTLRSILLSQ